MCVDLQSWMGGGSGTKLERSHKKSPPPPNCLSQATLLDGGGGRLLINAYKRPFNNCTPYPLFLLLDNNNLDYKMTKKELRLVTQEISLVSLSKTHNIIFSFDSAYREKNP